MITIDNHAAISIADERASFCLLSSACIIIETMITWFSFFFLRLSDEESKKSLSLSV